MTQSLDFKEISGRDAWPTIRGFVFQVDYTILRWLQLEQNDVLELECGEDIDIVQRDLAKLEISRELEQIKYREANVTLNADLTLELLKNFYDHIQNNPGMHIRFRFVTNTGYGHERPTIFLKGEKGIEKWMSLQQEDTVWEGNAIAEQLRTHIQSRITQNIIPGTKILSNEQQQHNEQWQGFHDFLDNAENLRDFILNFEWSTDQKNVHAVVETVLQAIRQVFKTEDPRSTYEKLFVHVFKLLSNKGPKRLDVQALRVEVQKTELNQQEKMLIGTLTALFEQFDQRLLKLEKGSEEQTRALQSVFQDIAVLKSDTTFSFRLQQLSTSPPEAILNGASRTEKVKMVTDFLNLLPWVAFHGINGSGKTQLASLVSRRYEHVFWLDLREFHEDLRYTAIAIERFLMNVSGCELQTDRKQWISDVIASLPEGSLLVINDVARLDQSVGALIDLFCHLTHAMDQSSVRMITTSNFKFPDALEQMCPEDCVFLYEDFDFDDLELKEYLTKQGAPPEFLTMVPFLAARAQRNPRLTTAMINRLKEINWGMEGGALLETVLNTEFAEGVLEDAQRSIIKYIGDQSSKELLYRLSLIDWAFGMEQVQAVSKVEAEISAPSEKLQPLLHLWIQLRQESKFEVSPIIRDIGLKNLSQDLVQKVHLAIGNSILKSKTINQSSGNRALMAFIKGKEFDHAGFVLIKMYEATQDNVQANFMSRAGYLDYWTSTDFPADMSLGMKMMIRQEQLRLYKLLDRDPSSLLAHTKKLLRSENVSVSEAAIGRMILITYYFQDLPVIDFIEYLTFTLEHLEEIQDVISVFEDEYGLKSLIWFPVMNLTSKEEVNAWITLMKIAAKKGIDAFTSNISRTSLSILCNAIGRREILSNDDDAGIAMLQGLFKFLIGHNREDMAAYPVRGLSQVESGWYNDPKNAVAFLLKHLKEFSDPHARFVLEGQMTKIYNKTGEKEKEKEWLEKTLAYDGEDRLELIEILLDAAASRSVDDPRASVDYCKSAVSIAKGYSAYGQVEIIHLLAELAVALWLSGDIAEMFLVLEDIVFRLFDTRVAKPGQFWMRMFSISGHLIAYASAMITDGRPPKQGGEDYFAPFQGMFNENNIDYSKYYQPKNDSFMLVQMAYIAGGIGEPEKAYDWSLKAFDEARTNGDQGTFYTVSSVSSHFAVISFKPTEAFETYLYNAAIMSHLPGSPEERKASLMSLSEESILSDKPGPKWAEAEHIATTFATVPLFVMLLTAFKTGQFEKNQMRAAYFKMLAAFEQTASDKLLFDLVAELSQKILDDKISTMELTTRANTFGELEKRNLQSICSLGVIHLTRDSKERLKQMVNILPYVQKVLSAARNLLEYTLVPFAQLHALDILKSNFVGSESELRLAEQEIEKVNKSDSNAIRDMINFARKTVPVDIPLDRQKWLDGAEF